MNVAYVVFVQIITKEITLHPNAPPSWDSILREIQQQFPTFNRSIKTLQRWFHKYRQEKGKEIQPLKSGRKTDQELLTKIKDHMLEQTRRAPSYRTAASHFQIPLSTARLYIKQHIGFQRKIRPTIPHDLTQQQKTARIYYSRIMMKILEISRDVGYKNIITGDESYFVYDYDSSFSYCLPGTSPNPRVKTDLRNRKLLLTIFLWGGGMCMLYDLHQGVTMTSSRFINTVINPIYQWWKERVELLQDDFDKIQSNTICAITAAKHEVERIAATDLSKWDEQRRPSSHKLDFVKNSELSAIEQLLSQHVEKAPAQDILLHQPISRQIPPPPPPQPSHFPPPPESSRPVLKSVTIKDEYKSLPPIQSLYASLLSTPATESTSISHWVPATASPFPTFAYHRSIRHTGRLSNIASLLLLLFGSRLFKEALLTLTDVDEEDLLMQDFLQIFHELDGKQVSPINIEQYSAVLDAFSPDTAINPLHHNLEIIRSQFYGNSTVIDAFNTTVTLKKKKNVCSTRYLEEVLGSIQLPSQPPTVLIVYIDRSLPRKKKVNTRFYFPVYDLLQIPQFPSSAYMLRGIIVHTAKKANVATNTDNYRAIVKEAMEGMRWTEYVNGKSTVLTDIGWPQKLAYGDDFDDECSSACLLLYEKSVLSSVSDDVHDSYTPYKHRSGFARDKAEYISSDQTFNPLSTPQTQRSHLLIHRTSSVRSPSTNSDSDSSSFLSTSTSSTLFSDTNDSQSDNSTMDESPIPSSSSLSAPDDSTQLASPITPDLLVLPDSHSSNSTPSSSSTISTPSPSPMNTPARLDQDFVVDTDGAIHSPGFNHQDQLPLELFLHLDNARVHTSQESSSFLKQLPFIKFPHPPYSPDIAPCDFFLFGYLKRKLAVDGVHSSDICNVVKRYLVEIDQQVYLRVFDHWHDRLAWVASHGGEYYPANNRRQIMDEYKHLYHLQSNSSSKNVEDKPYVCSFCNRRYSTKPSLQTHVSIKHADLALPHRSPSSSSCLRSLPLLEHNVSKQSAPDTPLNSLNKPQFSLFPLSSPHSICNAPVVKHFSCIPLQMPASHPRPHHLNLQIFYPTSNKTVILAGTLLLEDYRQYSQTLQQPESIPVPPETEQHKHQCRICSKDFSSLEALQLHSIRYHPDERLPSCEDAYVCTLCSARFASRRGLSTHFGMVHSQKSEANKEDVNPSCPYCERMFQSSVGLKMHISKMHTNVRDVFDEL